MDFLTNVLFGCVAFFYGVHGFRNDPNCGQNQYRHPKIIGGQAAFEAEFPWYVSIKETGQHICGGFIISQNLVLTASHCFRDFSNRAAESPKTISVTLAEHYFSRRKCNRHSYANGESKWRQDVRVKRIVRHPNYDAFTESAQHDIALLVLERKIQWNFGTVPVCLPTRTDREDANRTERDYFTAFREDRFTDFESGEIATVAGWSGSDDLHAAGGRESILQKVQLTLYSHDECRKILDEKNVTMKLTHIDSSVICAGSNDVGFDSCSGDSGSALLVQRDDVWVAIGIVSSGFGKCGTALPGLYTRLKSYLDWIEVLA